MREIKFRAWDYIAKTMHQYALVGFNGECWAHKNCPHNGEWTNIGCGRDDGDDSPYHYELLQFTGLCDKNGIEIYEGDIVNLIFQNYEDSCIVAWCNEWLCWASIHSDGKVFRFNPKQEEVVVIGNIHEGLENDDDEED